MLSARVDLWARAPTERSDETKENTVSIKRVDVVPVYVNDQDEALDFYVNKLGMEKLRDDPMGPDARWVQVKPQGAETSIVFVKGFADWSPDKVGGLQSITLWSDDAEATVDELRARGVEISQEATRQPWGMVEVGSKTRTATSSCSTAPWSRPPVELRQGGCGPHCPRPPSPGPFPGT